MSEKKDRPVFDATSTGKKLPRQTKATSQVTSRNRLTKLANLWKKTSADGSTYLSGTLGPVRVLVFQNRRRTSEKEATHVLFIAGSDDEPRHD